MRVVPKNGKFSPQRCQNHGKRITQRTKLQRPWKKEAFMPSSRSDPVLSGRYRSRLRAPELKVSTVEADDAALKSLISFLFP